jgi:hypothetical protein
MSKTRKYFLAYWAKKCMKAWIPEKDILTARSMFRPALTHKSISVVHR